MHHGTVRLHISPHELHRIRRGEDRKLSGSDSARVNDLLVFFRFGPPDSVGLVLTLP
jgi:hypothetical protein